MRLWAVSASMCAAEVVVLLFWIHVFFFALMHWKDLSAFGFWNGCARNLLAV
jgi:hypothetical protein